MDTIIELNGLTKDYNSFSGFSRKYTRALDDVSLNVEPGLIFGLLGQNGAGKTTLIKLLMGNIFPSAGSFKLFGAKTSHLTRRRIGYLPENPVFPGYLNPVELLRFFGRLYGMEKIKLEKRIPETLGAVQLADAAKKPVRTFSKGMTQRLGLAQALLHDPDLLILDEPSDGVDPIGRKTFRDILLRLKQESRTIFINSHILSEVELITDKVAILKQGRIIKTGSVKELTLAQTGIVARVEQGLSKLRDELMRGFTGISVIDDNILEYKVDNAAELNRLIDFLRGNAVLLTEIYHQKRSLEDVYMQLMNEGR